MCRRRDSTYRRPLAIIRGVPGGLLDLPSGLGEPQTMTVNVTWVCCG